MGKSKTHGPEGHSGHRNPKREWCEVFHKESNLTSSASRPLTPASTPSSSCPSPTLTTLYSAKRSLQQPTTSRQDFHEHSHPVDYSLGRKMDLDELSQNYTCGSDLSHSFNTDCVMTTPSPDSVGVAGSQGFYAHSLSMQRQPPINYQFSSPVHSYAMNHSPYFMPASPAAVMVGTKTLLKPSPRLTSLHPFDAQGQHVEQLIHLGQRHSPLQPPLSPNLSEQYKAVVTLTESTCSSSVAMLGSYGPSHPYVHPTMFIPSSPLLHAGPTSSPVAAATGFSQNGINPLPRYPRPSVEDQATARLSSPSQLCASSHSQLCSLPQDKLGSPPQNQPCSPFQGQPSSPFQGQPCSPSPSSVGSSSVLGDTDGMAVSLLGSPRQEEPTGALTRGKTTKTKRKEGEPYKYKPSYLDPAATCKVCLNDMATGNHYHIVTCEGCKGFFRRCVQKKLKGTLQCKDPKRPGFCLLEISKSTRNKCQYCRFKRCLDAGMREDMVLNDIQREAKNALKAANRQRREEERKHQEKDANPKTLVTELDKAIIYYSQQALQHMKKVAEEQSGVKDQERLVSAKELLTIFGSDPFQLVRPDFNAAIAFCHFFQQEFLTSFPPDIWETDFKPNITERDYDIQLYERVLNVLYVWVAVTYRESDGSLCFRGLRITKAEVEKLPSDIRVWLILFYESQRCNKSRLMNDEELAVFLAEIFTYIIGPYVNRMTPEAVNTYEHVTSACNVLGSQYVGKRKQMQNGKPVAVAFDQLPAQSFRETFAKDFRWDLFRSNDESEGVPFVRVMQLSEPAGKNMKEGESSRILATETKIS